MGINKAKHSGLLREIARGAGLFLLAAIFAASRSYGAPDAVTNLKIASGGFRHLVLSWTAPYDTASSTAAAFYNIRMSTYTPIISEGDWNSNSSINSAPYNISVSTSGVGGGEPVNFTVTGLVDGVNYFFAVKSSTDGINWSGLDTSSPEPFSSPYNTNPGNVNVNNLMYGQIVYTSTPTLTWGAPSCGSSDANYGDFISSYTIEVSTDILFVNKITKDSHASDSWVTPPLSENTTYYWRVKAMDSEGLYSLSYPTQADRRFIVNASSEPPSSCALASPINNQIFGGLQPNLQWAAATDPDPNELITYTVFFSTNPNFSLETTTTVPSVADIQYQVTFNLIENATYYWKVFSVDFTSMQTQSASTGVFEINASPEAPAAFAQTAPANGEMVLISTPTLAWQASSDPDPGDSFSYTVIYSSSDPTLLDAAEYHRIDGIGATYYKLPELSEAVSYYWQVHAIDLTPLDTFTAIRSFFVNAVEAPPSAFNLLSSSGIVSTQSPVFTWETAVDPDGDTVRYNIFVSTAQDFSVYSSSAGLLNTGYTASPLNENATYYWKVEAYDYLSNTRASNQSFKIFINAIAEPPAAFELVAPANSSASAYLNPIFDWGDTSDPDPGDYVASYTLFYSTYQDFSVQSQVAGISVSSYSLTSNLENGATYYWKVLAASQISGQRFSNSTWYFTAANQPPSSFSLLSSSGIISTASPLLSWQAASDPESDNFTYTFIYSRNSDFSAAISSAGLTAANYALSSLEENAQYFWYARAVDSWNNERNSSQTFSFYINALAEAPAAFSLNSPADKAAVGTTKPQLLWNQTSDPDPGEGVTYSLWYSRSPDFTSRTEINSLTSAAYTFTEDLVIGATYYWRVYAAGTDSLTAQSADRSFVVVEFAKPLAPSGFAIAVSADKKKAVLSWEAVTKNEDGTALGNLSGYRVYRSYDFDSLFTATAAATLGAATLSWSDDDVYGRSFFYMVKAFNAWGTESQPSKIFKAGSENTYLLYPADKSLTVEIPVESISPEVQLNIERHNDLETGSVLAAYSVKAVGASGELPGYKFSKSVKFSFKYSALSAARQRRAPGSETLTTGVFWFNGVEWVFEPGARPDGSVTVDSVHTGLYQLRTVSRSTEFNTLSVWPKIITPNSDGVNDELNYTFENPGLDPVEGYIYELSGSRAARMSAKTDYWLIWPGTDDSGNRVVPGIYIYQVRCGDRIYNGTVVVAR